MAKSGCPQERPDFSLGVTQLLDELLTEEEKAELDAVPRPVDSQTDAAPETADTSTGSTATAESAKLAEPEGPPGLRRTASFISEVDEYLASLHEWKDNARRRREELKASLESGLDAKINLDCTEGMLDQALRVNQAKVAELYKELEELQQRACKVEEFQQRADAEVAESVLEGTTGFTASCASKGLSVWCQEEDHLHESAFASEDGPMAQPPLAKSVTIEGQLERMQGALGVAKSRLKVDLSQLDKLLAECDDAQALWSTRSADSPAFADPLAATG
eukprot:TRINITY_DN38532_c0_g1_i1.p1 TRINITY_DN38532_c0_g1~~TRINITY_DN38532_c0_g1_i1.p1  ORF type:complete len:277 (+),score=74.26 TRINITY_DN38532_c0_g1_i1:109-939(+)